MPFLGPEPMENSRGVLQAWDPVKQKLVWRTPGGGGIGGGTVTTAGNLVFQSTNDGRLLAYSADKGEKLLEVPLGRSGSGPPITFTVDGKQRIAMLAGLGRRPTPSGPTDAKVDNPPLLYVFELDGKTPLPVMVTPPAASPKQAP
jgi:quinohemoprotein ethanol dehydrogenase